MKNTNVDLQTIKEIPINNEEISHFLNYILFRESECAPYLKNHLWLSYKDYNSVKTPILIHYSTDKEQLQETSKNIIISWPHHTYFIQKIIFFLQYEKFDSYRVHDDLQDLFLYLKTEFKSQIEQAKVYYLNKELPNLKWEEFNAYIHNYFSDLIAELVPHQILLKDLILDKNYLSSILSPNGSMLSLFSSENNPSFKTAINLILKMLSYEKINKYQPIQIPTLKRLLENSPYGWDIDAINCLLAYLIMRQKVKVMYNNLYISPLQYAINRDNGELMDSLVVFIP